MKGRKQIFHGRTIIALHCIGGRDIRQFRQFSLSAWANERKGYYWNTNYRNVSQSGNMENSKYSNSIKRPLSAYMIFYREQLEDLKNREPKMSYVKMTKLSSERWAAVDQSVKDHYYKLARMDKERYRQERAAAGLMRHEVNRGTLPEFCNFLPEEAW